MSIRIRAATPEDAASIGRVHVDSWRSTYAGIVPADYLACLSYRNRESAWKQLLTADRPGTCCFVAETEDGDIVGFANTGPEREGNSIYGGELYAIYILEGYQRMGIWASSRLTCDAEIIGRSVQFGAAVGAGGQSPRLQVLRVAGR